jgi:hypothetical protein
MFSAVSTSIFRAENIRIYQTARRHPKTVMFIVAGRKRLNITAKEGSDILQLYVSGIEAFRYKVRKFNPRNCAIK